MHRSDVDLLEVLVVEAAADLHENGGASTGLQVGITVTDNPSIGKTLNEGARSSVPCFSHTVNLIVSEAIKSQRMVQSLLSTARKICERVQRSPRAKAKLAKRVPHLERFLQEVTEGDG